MSISPADLQQSVKSLASHISGEVYVDRHRRALYGSDASIYQIEPVAVVAPRHADDVAATLAWAAENGVPLIPRGGGTSLSGQSIGAGVVLDFSRYMNRIIELDPEARIARVEPGVVLDHLNLAAAKHGLQFAPDVATSSRATIGGMIGNNSAGARSIRHGKTVDHVIALDVILASGERLHLAPCTREELAAKQSLDTAEGRIYREVDRVTRENRDEIAARFPKVLRRVGGYNLDEFVAFDRGYELPLSAAAAREALSRRFPGADFNLAKLIVGAEGTLACMTQATVHLTPLPKYRALVSLEFESIATAVGAVPAILEFGPSALELIDGLIVQLARKSLEYRHYLDFVTGQPDALLIVEFSGDDPAEIERQAHALDVLARTLSGVQASLPVVEPAMVAHVWACRKAGLPLLLGIPGAKKPIAFVEDTAVSPARLPEFVARFREILTRAGVEGAFYGHASVGCLHIRPMIDTADAGDLEKFQTISRETCELVMEFGGAMSGEHGDGLARSYLNETFFGPTIYRAFKDVKAAFDPLNLMNPGKIVDAPSPVENLRRDPQMQPLEVVTGFDYTREGGFLAAAEMCNGSGVCRKTLTGTMCPSFMVTLDERHSTRGRANALRLTLSGKLPPEELTSDAMHETYSLCLQCKGCKAECPSNVDVAKLKAEFLHLRRQRRGLSLADWAMGHVADLNRIGSALAPVSNWLGRSALGRVVAEKLFGVDRRRPAPTFVRNHFAKWFDRRARPQQSSRGQVVLLDDCLTSYCEPHVNRAAVEVLEAAGFEVHRAGLHCCGRAMISKGLLPEAKELARENVATLLRWVDRGAKVVGCEPSCLLTLTDDYLDLLPGPDAQRVAANASLVDDFLAPIISELPLRTDRARVLLHGHCHQKALVGMQATQTLLTSAGADVNLVDSGCCGMAGSFGYEHYEPSMQIGERVLFPAARSATDSVIVASGFSCRHQIAHGADRAAIHPIEFVAQRLAPAVGRPTA